MKLSVVIIAKNAEKYIADAIDSVLFADEIIIVDNDSTDLTTEIAKKMSAKVYSFSTENFAAARNYGLKKAKGDWLLYIDTDERVSQELAVSIQHIISVTENEMVAYKVTRKNFYFGSYEWPQVEKLERLFRRKKLKEWYGKLHESPRIEGPIGELDGFLLHYTHQNLSLMVEKTNTWSDTEAQLRILANHPAMMWWRFFRVMVTAFYDSYIKQKGWKAGTVGILEGIYQSYSMFITYAKLWELQNNNLMQQKKKE